VVSGEAVSLPPGWWLLHGSPAGEDGFRASSPVAFSRFVSPHRQPGLCIGVIVLQKSAKGAGTHHATTQPKEKETVKYAKYANKM
jgi:hypothetical protein